MPPTPAAGCCPHPSYALSAPPGPGSPDITDLVSHLYMCEGLSTYRIGEIVGMNRQRVGRLLAAARVPVKPRGAGRCRNQSEERVAADELLTRLYLEVGLSSVQISELTGIPQRTVRDRLRSTGARMRTRGPLNREDRAAVSPERIAELYVAAGLTAAEVGRMLGVSHHVVLRSAHDEGFPVRVGGPEPAGGPAEIELVEALYADPLVGRALARHGVTHSPPGGPIWQRFSVPQLVTPELAEELYAGCGLSARHIELLTGQPAQTILRILHASGVARRPAGGRSPFLRRWRAAGGGN